MPRPCTVCSHSDRDKIDRAILDGASNRAVASQYRVTSSSVDRHRREHLGVAMAAAAQRKADLEADHGDDLLGMAFRLQREALELLETAKAEGRHHLVLAAIDRLQKGTALLATLKETPAGLPTRITVKWADACPHPCPECAAKWYENPVPPLLALPSGANGSGEVIDVTPTSRG